MFGCSRLKQHLTQRRSRRRKVRFFFFFFTFIFVGVRCLGSGLVILCVWLPLSGRRWKGNSFLFCNWIDCWRFVVCVHWVLQTKHDVWFLTWLFSLGKRDVEVDLDIPKDAKKQKKELIQAVEKAPPKKNNKKKKKKKKVGSFFHQAIFFIIIFLVA